jgi:predicted negative regulator of RcsB-dependent stress response
MMMQTDDEQLEELKRWWKKYGGPVITGLVVGLALVFGARFWMDHQERQRLTASAEYEQLRSELNIGNIEAARSRTAYLTDKFKRTPYAVLASLALASAQVEQKQLEDARGNLRWALDNAREPELKDIARLRLARVEGALGNYDAALATLGSSAPAAFAAAYEELRGDLYVASGDAQQARAAYERALEALKSGPGSELVQLKLNNLGVRG